MVWSSCRPGVLVSAVALAMIAGCTPSGMPTQAPTAIATPSSTPTQSGTSTPTPSVTPTWDANQAAAIDAVVRFFAADAKIGADPASFTEKQMTELLETAAGGAALKSTLRWHLRLKEHDYHFIGEMVVLSTLATKPVDDGRGIEVHVTRCQDQRQGKVMDKDGNPVSAEDFLLPLYNLRQYSVRKPPGEDVFRVFGFETINGVCP